MFKNYFLFSLFEEEPWPDVGATFFGVSFIDKVKNGK